MIAKKQGHSVDIVIIENSTIRDRFLVSDDAIERGKKLGFGQWSKSTVHGMLTNETYAGVWRYSKRINGRTKNPIDTQTVITVPAIVSRDLWDADQARCAENKEKSQRNRKHDYLLSGLLTCGQCGAKVIGHTYIDRRIDRTYQYYHCPAVYIPEHYPGRSCKGIRFRLDELEQAIWDWIKSLLTEPERLVEGLALQQEKQEKENAPLRERLEVIDDLLADHRLQLERLLDLYLAEGFPKEVLTERKERLDTTMRSLEKERNNLLTHLSTRTLTPKQIETIQEFAGKMGKGLVVAELENNFSARRQILVDLAVQAVLAVEGEDRVAHVQCILGEQVLSVVSGSSRRGSRAGSQHRGTRCSGTKTNGRPACPCSGWSLAGRARTLLALLSWTYCSGQREIGQTVSLQPMLDIMAACGYDGRCRVPPDRWAVRWPRGARGGRGAGRARPELSG